MKTDQEIKEEIFQFISGSRLADEVSGVVTTRKRPLNSKSEDVLISVLANVNEQRQQVIVNVNIYVQDQNVKKNGQYEEAGERLGYLSKIAADLMDVFWIGPARIHLQTQHTVDAGNDREHVINNRLLYEIENV